VTNAPELDPVELTVNRTDAGQILLCLRDRDDGRVMRFAPDRAQAKRIAAMLVWFWWFGRW
jgi:hypothetical protein